MSTSAAPGYLRPDPSSFEKADQELRVFLQGLIVGMTGIAGSLVRPRWQPEPPSTPDYGIDWAAVGVTAKNPDRFAHVGHISSGEGQDQVYRNEILSVLVSFYGPNAERNADMMSLGFQVSQNRDQLQVNGYGLVEVENTTTIPELVNERWLMRVDLPFSLRRAQVATYNVLNLQGAQVDIEDESTEVNLNIAP